MNDQVHPLFQEILNGVMACPLCKYTGGHSQRCPSQLATVEQRIRRAARLCDSYEYSRAIEVALEDKISPLEIEAGRKLANVMQYNRGLIYSHYGHPEYGSYTVSPQHLAENKAREMAVINAHLSKLEAERKPAMSEQLTLEEQLVASIAVVNYRKGKVA